MRKENKTKPEYLLKPCGLAKTGENAAADFYLKKGYSIIKRNWRIGRYAEVDLIVKDPSGILVFVEVKTRRKPAQEFGFQLSGFDTINWLKQKKIVTSAQIYLRQNSWAQIACRFDVIVVYFDKTIDYSQSAQPNIIHVSDAFSP